MRYRRLLGCCLVLAAGLCSGAKTLSPLERALAALAGQPAAAGNTLPAVEPAKPVTALPDPLGLTATATAEAVLLSWSNTQTSRTIDGYLVSRAEAGRILALLSPGLIAATSYQDLSATAGTWYSYQVTAVTASGDTLVSSAVILSSLPPAQPPVPPEVIATSLEERVHLKWKKPGRTSFEVAGYLVRRTAAPSEPYQLLTEKAVTREEYYDEALEPRRPYTYQVLAVDARGQTSAAGAEVMVQARPRSRSGLILMSSAYRGVDWLDTGLTGDLQFTYYIGTLYGEQDPELSPLAVYLDPISLWLLSADAKYTLASEKTWPVAVAAGGKAALQLFAGQQSQTSGQFTFSNKSELDYVWGGYVTASRSFGDLGVHGGYLFGSYGDPIFYLSKYLSYSETFRARNLVYVGLDVPLARRVNLTWEILYPLDAELQSLQHPVLVNMHVDRLFNFDIAYLHWDQGWAFLGYFNLRFTLFPSAP